MPKIFNYVFFDFRELGKTVIPQFLFPLIFTFILLAVDDIVESAVKIYTDDQAWLDATDKGRDIIKHR